MAVPGGAPKIGGGGRNIGGGGEIPTAAVHMKNGGHLCLRGFSHGEFSRLRTCENAGPSCRAWVRIFNPAESSCFQTGTQLTLSLRQLT